MTTSRGKMRAFMKFIESSRPVSLITINNVTTMYSNKTGPCGNQDQIIIRGVIFRNLPAKIPLQRILSTQSSVNDMQLSIIKLVIHCSFSGFCLETKFENKSIFLPMCQTLKYNQSIQRYCFSEFTLNRVGRPQSIPFSIFQGFR